MSPSFISNNLTQYNSDKEWIEQCELIKEVLLNNNGSTIPVKCRIEHLPFNSELWSGRIEPDESDRACYWYQVAQRPETCSTPARVTLIGFACDQGVRRNLGRVGAKQAPTTIRQAFAKLPLSGKLLNKYAIKTAKATSSTQHLPLSLPPLLADAGDIICHDSDQIMPQLLERTQLQYSNLVAQTINSNSLAIGLGGGHAIAYGSYLGVWQSVASNVGVKSDSLDYRRDHCCDKRAPRIGIINFDAHLDIRMADNGTSGTPFRQIAEHNQHFEQDFYYLAIGISQFSNTAALFDRANDLGVFIISDDTCVRLPWPGIAAQLNAFLDKVDYIYLTIDMDGFSASIVPGVSAPAAKGMSLDFVERCLEVIFASSKVKMVDIAEINPTYDIDGRSSKVAARLLALMIEHHLLLDMG